MALAATSIPHRAVNTGSARTDFDCGVGADGLLQRTWFGGFGLLCGCRMADVVVA
jgi:hypothetical protein